MMIDKYKNEFDEIIVYTPNILKNLGYDNLCNEYKEHGVIVANIPQKNIGFSKWKPLICILELSKSSKDDIIVYHDVDCLKYPVYLQFVNVKNTINNILDRCNYDFFFLRSMASN
jgi:hypothetical protein